MILHRAALLLDHPPPQTVDDFLFARVVLGEFAGRHEERSNLLQLLGEAFRHEKRHLAKGRFSQFFDLGAMEELGFTFHQIERDEFWKRQSDIGKRDVGKLHHIGVYQLPMFLAGKAVLLVVDGEIQFLQQSKQPFYRPLVDPEVFGQFLLGCPCRGAQQINRSQHPHHLFAIHGVLLWKGRISWKSVWACAALGKNFTRISSPCDRFCRTRVIERHHAEIKQASIAIKEI